MREEKRQSWKSFLRLIKETKLPYFQILLCVVTGLGVSELNLLFPSYTEQIMAGDFSVKIIVATILVLFGGAIADMAYQVVCQIVNSNISKKFRDALWKKIVKLPMAFYDDNGVNELISRETEDTEKLSNFLTDDISGIVSNIYTLIVTIVILMGYDWHLVIAEIVIVPIIIIIGIVKGRVDFSLNDHLQYKAAMLTGGVAEILTNVPLIKTFVQEEKATKQSDDLAEELYKTKMKITWIGNAFSAISTILEVVESLIVILFGIYLIRKEYITVSIWVAFYMYSTNLTGCVDSLMQVWDDLKVAQGAMKRVSEIYATETEDYESGKELTCTKADIKFEDVSFAYEDKNVLDNISFTIENGKHTAIVGLSGAGKTTILNLIERLYHPTSGGIFLNDESIDQYSLKSWRSHIGYVTQDAWIVDGSIRDNLLYALSFPISDERLVEELREIGMEGLEKEFVDGLDTQVGEGGSRLSGGQRQRICLARTLLTKPSILLLDEVTANLDALTESMILEAIRKMNKKPTVISIVHKLGTIKNADKIIVMEEGKIRGQGSHEELLQECDLYKNMYEQQKGKEATVL